MRLSDAEVYEKFADQLVRFATGLVGPFDAADVVADTFVRVLRSGSWPDAKDRRSYLYRAVVNEARMRHRSTMRRRAREMRAADRKAVDDREIRPEVMPPWMKCSLLTSVAVRSSPTEVSTSLNWQILRPVKPRGVSALLPG